MNTKESSEDYSDSFFSPQDFSSEEIDVNRNKTVSSGKNCLKTYLQSSCHDSLLKKCVARLLKDGDWSSNVNSLTWKEMVVGNCLLFHLSSKYMFGDVPEGEMAPTTTVQEVEHSKMELTKNGRRKSRDGIGSHSVGLMDAVANLPIEKKNFEPLLPTPTRVNRVRSKSTMAKCAAFRKRNANQNTVPLYLAEKIAMIPMLPTPTTRDWKGARKPETLAAAGRLPSNSLEDTLFAMKYDCNQQDGEVGTQKNGLKLQPKLVEWMMGYPSNWTNLNEIEIKAE